MARIISDASIAMESTVNRLLFFFCLFLISFMCRVDGGGLQYKYLGCYSDSVDLRAKTMTKESLTLADCAGFCQGSGYPIAGLQSVKTCYCGMVYDVAGKSSTGCNNTNCAADTPLCGGHLTNDVYYSVETTSAKGLVVVSVADSFASARMTCVRNGGDVACPSDTNAYIFNALSNHSNITNIWIGLYRKQDNDVSGNYYWTDETLGILTPNKSLYDSHWAKEDLRNNPCVSLDIKTGKWWSVDCTTPRPFVCKQPPNAPAGGSTNPGENTDSTADDVTSNSKKLALFIVLPLFLVCYGGSCIFYCVHKIIKNCYRKNRPKMNLNQAEDGQKGPGPGGPGQGASVPPYRPLSAGKRVGVFPSGPHPPMPIYMMDADLKQKLTGADPMTGKGTDHGTAPVTARVVKLSMDAPPKYGGGGPEDERRARLLENASRESRMRREKETDEGRAPSRPFTAPRRPPPHGTENDRAPAAAESHGSTTQLIGRETEAPKGAEGGRGGRGGGQQQQPGSSADDLNNTPISEILKAKVAQKADKKRPRKIITA